MAGGRLARKGPSIPVQRAIAAVERIVATWQSAKSAEDRFFDWVHRQDDKYFNELLADLVDVQPEAVEGLLQDYGEATDFKPAQLGGGECAGAAQVFIGAAFFAAAPERRYRDAFFAQRRVPQALECAKNDVRLIAQGIHDLLNPVPSFKVKKTIDDLSELAAALHEKAPANIVDPLQSIAAALGSDATADADWDRVFAQSDAWVRDAAAFCVAKDPQLDLGGALPGDRSSTRPITFRKRVPDRPVSAPATVLANAPAAAAEVYEPIYHG
jgi:sulfite reductase (NADPH) hemoprotein beta-component